MTITRIAFPLVLVLTVASCARRSEPAAAKSPSAGASMVFSDEFFSFEYPEEYSAFGTKPTDGKNLTPHFGLKLKAPSRGTLSFLPDPFYPDMIVRDAAETMAKGTVTDGGRVFGTVRKLAVKNGTCIGFVATGPNRKCPENVGFSPASGRCYDGQFWAFCESPKGKHFVMSGDLGSVPTPDKLTPEAARLGKIHERVLASLEFKSPPP